MDVDVDVDESVRLGGVLKARHKLISNNIIHSLSQRGRAGGGAFGIREQAALQPRVHDRFSSGVPN